MNSLTNYERATRARYTSSNFGLARMNRLLAALGHPQRRYKSVHIAGTKGKGSVATMLASMLRPCGLKVGLYTSPHILSIRERIIVNGDRISEAAFARAVAAVAGIAVRARVPEPTYFEVLTAAAFLFFAEKRIDIAVVETGLGGRLDSTNVLRPEVVGITSISYDHVSQLGPSLTSIAKEKAGVFKNRVPIVCAPQRESVKQTLRDAAEAVNAPLRFADENVDFSYRFEFSRTAGRHARICLTTPESRFEHLHVPLLGAHQATNCAVALNILDVLKSRGFPIDDQKAMTGLEDIQLAGRMEMICERPRILVDGAHNAASVEAVMRAIGQNIPYDSMVVIFACQKDKDITGMIRQVQLGADKCIFTWTGSPRSADPVELGAEYTEQSGRTAQVADSLEDAMQIALSAVTREDLICITGSFYIVGEAKRRYTRTTNNQ
ncbi:MAG: bifunctional folylpolyglutamate synthase/dihydrofolate synthase [Phycisphaerae bacterium]